ncbi:urea carboxylase [Phormidesmis priestleyi ULC007]|uniref:Urea carboxylase n=1 Tax=Phormidesmis priestleyi ULC007 TaxID=1920490 RepID=A0A2T1DB35_9CYAN|nr:urea carboxylase [Phormidesmis priestleyi]PSB17742.1 urea carboxylase [Phormidesmis priestleyi ULC007]PZO48683.1 MAG: urea carboxylase [Phormidesmis priestleyi]
MFNKVLVANRGEIACRIIRTLDRLKIASVAVYSEADAYARHVTMAGEAVEIGAAIAADSYLRWERILEAAQQTDAQAIHPGYGFLSENAEFAEACAAANIVFIGPTPDQMRRFGLKHTARELAAQNQVPLLPGSSLLGSLEEAQIAASTIGYPVMLKSTAGGGGIGLQLCRTEAALPELFQTVQRLSQNNFGQSGVYLEKYVDRARHLEVQIFGDGSSVIALGERDCSIQRRNQKVIEETPAPGISDQLRHDLADAAVRLAKAVNYQSAGTVEFVFDATTSEFYFLEVNTRLQVEHGITEEVTGVDLVEWMVRLAADDLFPLEEYRHQPKGHSIQVRIYAEDPGKNFQPSSGLLTEVVFPHSVRCDTWVDRGTEITPFYDPLIAKVIVHGDSREDTIEQLKSALDECQIAGLECNLDYLRQILDNETYNTGDISTRFLESFHYTPSTIDVLEPGTFSTIQDYPGRTGYWDVGVPPSGPMDSLAFRFANQLVGNSSDAAGLEFTVSGPTLRFNTDAVICLTGAEMQATIDDNPVSLWTTISISAGSILRLKSIQGHGCRTYLAVQNGFKIPDYLGSKATFTLGQFGGHCGRTLRTGDVLKLHRVRESQPLRSLPSTLIPHYTNTWKINVLYGPHGAPDFFTELDIATFFATDWEVHYNSSRTGVRLIGPKPQWARTDGGEAGLHPSNIHDNAYAIGTIDFTGDMPVILGPDGPSLGGFVCPATIVQSDLWKVGQLKPGDTIRFHQLTFAEALQKELEQDQEINTLQKNIPSKDAVLITNPSEFLTQDRSDRATLHEISETPDQIAVTYRPSGDKYLLIEYGELVLDLNLRFRVHALMTRLQSNPIAGILDLTPGIRSLQVHYDSRVLHLEQLLETLLAAEKQLPAIEDMEVPTRIIHLPLSWEDESTLLAIQKYMQSVRSDAPWCPSNIEFIRRINGLDSVEQVKEIVFNASYLVMGLGDVYLGAPVATPIDPRHRLVTTKYNPARTWTPENAVGIGGAYLCVYGMEGPGGYQFVGRTVQMWNRYQQTADFQAGKPWLLRFFDQIRFYPMSAPDLLKYREAFIQGKVKLEIQEKTFSLRHYNEFLRSIANETIAFKTTQQSAFEAERDRWAELNIQVETAIEPPAAIPESELELSPNSEVVKAHMPANVWQIVVEKGNVVEVGDKLVVLEAMKMEIAIIAPVSGTILNVRCTQGQLVAIDQVLFVIQTEV